MTTILGVNQIGYKEAIKVDNDGHLIISGNTGGGSGGGSAVLPPTTTAGSISGVGVFGKSAGSTTTYSPLNVDAAGHLLVSASGLENTVLIQGHDGTNQKNVLVEQNGSLRTTNATLDGCVVATVLATSNTYVDACVDDGAAHSASAVLTTTNPKITSGQAPLDVGAGLQQVLMYGKHSDGRLFPLESDGDRLRVVNGDVSVAAQQTGNTMTQAKCFQFLGTNGTQMRTVKTDDNGNLQVDIVSGGGAGGSESYALTQYYSNATIAMNTQTNLITLAGVSVPEIKFFFDTETPFTNFYGIGSNDNSNWFVLYPENAQMATPIPAEANTATYPTTNGAEPYPRNFIQFVFKHPPKYIRFRNGSASQNNVQSHYIITTN